MAECRRVVKAGATNLNILLGVFFEALFFASLLILMSKSDISFLWPLTGLSFVFATFAAMWFLHEQVSAVRWAGVVCIMIGAGLISYSEHAKPKLPAAPISSQPGSSAPASAQTDPLPHKLKPVRLLDELRTAADTGKSLIPPGLSLPPQDRMIGLPRSEPASSLAPSRAG